MRTTNKKRRIRRAFIVFVAAALFSTLGVAACGVVTEEQIRQQVEEVKKARESIKQEVKEEVLLLQKAKRWVEQEVKEEVPRLQKARQWIEEEPQDNQKQEEEQP